ncbi:hypothetical protein FHS89_003229 [Rubricella aquisinus]|uniref:Uncharacterized protein n=1 Tax=Rubricella aquisinus TaxID=2028108 RepID=A0A840WU24_9RHOB|nr:hypothetical protein [Rubricella aquisinus]
MIAFGMDGSAVTVTARFTQPGQGGMARPRSQMVVSDDARGLRFDCGESIKMSNRLTNARAWQRRGRS